MARERITMVVGNVEDFEAFEIDIKTSRKSAKDDKIGLKSKAIKHKEELSSVDLNKILVDVLQNNAPYAFVGDDELTEMLKLKEWKNEER